MKGSGTAVLAFRAANTYVWRRGIWKYLLLPVLLTGLYLPVAAYVGIAVSGPASDWLMSLHPALTDLNAAARYSLQAFILLTLMVLIFFTYRSVVMIFYSPFLDHISETIEEQALGERLIETAPWWNMVLRVLKIFCLTLTAIGGVFAAGCILSLIPFLGTLLGIVVVFPLQLFLSGVAYIDPVLGRSGLSATESFHLMRRHFGIVAVFALLGNLLLLVPVVGWFVGPTYSVMAGVVLGLHLTGKFNLRTSGAKENEG